MILDSPTIRLSIAVDPLFIADLPTEAMVETMVEARWRHSLGVGEGNSGDDGGG